MFKLTGIELRAGFNKAVGNERKCLYLAIVIQIIYRKSTNRKSAVKNTTKIYLTILFVYEKVQCRMASSHGI